MSGIELDIKDGSNPSGISPRPASPRNSRGKSRPPIVRRHTANLRRNSKRGSRGRGRGRGLMRRNTVQMSEGQRRIQRGRGGRGGRSRSARIRGGRGARGRGTRGRGVYGGSVRKLPSTPTGEDDINEDSPTNPSNRKIDPMASLSPRGTSTPNSISTPPPVPRNASKPRSKTKLGNGPFPGGLLTSDKNVNGEKKLTPPEKPSRSSKPKLKPRPNRKRATTEGNTLSTSDTPPSFSTTPTPETNNLSRSSNSVSCTTTTQESIPMTKRDRVLKELMETEASYNIDLDIIAQVWMRRIEEAGVISDSDYQTIFAPKMFTGIKHLNKALLNDLAGVELLPLDDQDVGKRFQGLTASLLLYTPYCANQTSAIIRIKTLEKTNSKFAALAEEIRQQPECSRLDLPSYLIKPMQRITKYPLLIKALIESTPPDHFDYETLVECLQKLEEIVSEINSKKEKSENLEKLVELQNRFSDDIKLVSPTRRLLSNHNFRRIKVGQKTHKKALLFLFNDGILVASTSKLSKKLVARSDIMSVNDMWVWDVKDESSPGFALVRSGGAKVTCFVETEQEKEEWITRINLLIAGDHLTLRGKDDSAVVLFERGGKA